MRSVLKNTVIAALATAFLAAGFLSDANAAVKVINKDHVGYNLEMICGAMHEDLGIQPWSSAILTFEGDQMPDQDNDVCTLTILSNGNSIDLVDMTIYFIVDGELSGN